MYYCLSTLLKNSHLVASVSWQLRIKLMFIVINIYVEFCEDIVFQLIWINIKELNCWIMW